MDLYYIYLITRDDGKKYVGQTTHKRYQKRLYEHRWSKRFRGHNFDARPVYSCYSKEEANLKEKETIKEYDTFRNGLNDTEDGTGNHGNPKLTTKNYKYSEESRKKMSDAGKKKVFTQEWRDNLSKAQKGRISWNKGVPTEPKKLSREQVIEIRRIYNERPAFERVGSMGNNGRPITYDNEFSKHYGEIYKVSAQLIRLIIQGKCRKYDV